MQNPEKTAAPKEILQASKPSGHVAYVCKVDLADIILSAETAALEDGYGSVGGRIDNALQHHSIRSILGTATNVYCFGVDGGKETRRRVHIARPYARSMNECPGF